jgi:predicted nucleotidyltransferase
MAPAPRDLARALVDRRRVARIRSEERAAHLRERLHTLAPRLHREGAFEAAWLVGSLAWGGFGERSDVDVVVRGSDPSRLGALWAAFGDALGAPVDLLRIEDLPEGFARRVLAEGQRLDEP